MDRCGVGGAALETPPWRDWAQTYATLNYPDYWTIVAAEVVVLGNWDGASTFTAGGGPINAVRVVAGRREPGSIQREIPARGHAIESRTRDA